MNKNIWKFNGLGCDAGAGMKRPPKRPPDSKYVLPLTVVDKIRIKPAAPRWGAGGRDRCVFKGR